MFSNCFERPKKGRKFEVIGVCRISTDHQDEMSLSDQEAYYREYLDRTYGTENYNLTIVAGRGSGQYLDREEYLELCAKVESGKYDAVVSEDLSRIVRRVHAYLFCELGEDSSTRVIAINDFVDTKDANWRQAAFFATFRHESYCRDTSQRIQRSLRNRFMDGRVFQCPIYGYIKPHPHATDSEITKDPEAERVYGEIFSRLENGENYRQIADWLNKSGVSTGPYCRLDEWSGAMVKRIVFNPILKGERVRNKRVTRRVNRTGRPKTEPAPKDFQLSRDVPHLAFIDPDRYDRVIRMLVKRNAKYKRSESERNDPRAGVPRKRTRWPGQHLRCGVCGRIYVFGGHGQKERLMCNGSRDHKCWNGMTVSGPQVASAVANQLLDRIRQLPNFDQEWMDAYEVEREERIESANGQLNSLRSELQSNQRKRENRVQLLDQLGFSPATVNDIRTCENRIAELQDEIGQLQSSQDVVIAVPTIEEINAVATDAFLDLPRDSEEFAQMMRSVIDDFFVLPYRLADGGHIQPKVKFKANLGHLIGNNQDLPILDLHGVVDLTTQPKRLQYLNDIVDMVSKGMKHAEIAKRLGIFKTEVGYAMRLHRCMQALGTDDPWIPILSEDQVVKYFQRVRNSRFSFDPLPGFEYPRTVDM